VKRIFSILFALVLACSFSLVTAVPVGAQDPPNPTFATVSIPSMTTPSTKITIGWERASDHGLPDIPEEVGTPGDAIHVTTSEATLDYAMVIVPTDFILGEVTEISYWGYTVSGDVKAPDEIFLFLQKDGVVSILTSHKPSLHKGGTSPVPREGGRHRPYTERSRAGARGYAPKAQSSCIDIP